MPNSAPRSYAKQCHIETFENETGYGAQFVTGQGGQGVKGSGSFLYAKQR